MINLSDRMKAIADQIIPGQIVADIGTDHAIIPIYLCQRGLAAKVILTDINEGPLQKARENIEKLDLSQHISDIRIGPGLSVLKPGEAETVIIAGMGGILIAEILEDDINKSRSFSKFILQPRTSVKELRVRLHKRGFAITNEHLALEKGRITEIITMSPDDLISEKEEFVEEMDFEIPRLLFKNKDPLLESFIDKKLKQTQTIIDNLCNSISKDSTKQVNELIKRIKGLEERKSKL